MARRRIHLLAMAAVAAWCCVAGARAEVRVARKASPKCAGAPTAEQLPGPTASCEVPPAAPPRVTQTTPAAPGQTPVAAVPVAQGDAPAAQLGESPAANVGDSAARRPPLMGMSLTFGEAESLRWRAKDNARVRLAWDAGNAYLRLQSDFHPFAFTWAMRPLDARPLGGGAARLRFRVRGDGSRHVLEVRLGVVAPDGGRPLYYINRSEVVPLDFVGWKTVTLDLARFRTPANGRRNRDLENVGFLEFMVYARGPRRVLDLGLDDVEVLAADAADLALQRRQGVEAARLVDAIGRSMPELRRGLARLRDEIDAAGAAGKDVETARLYWSALQWCVDDLGRRSAAGDYAVVRPAPELCDAIRRRLERPDAVRRQIGLKAATSTPPATPRDNPFAQSVWDRVVPYTRRELSWPKGAAGYAAVRDAWQFRRFGEEAYGIVWSLVRPGMRGRREPVLMGNVLSLLDLIAHQHSDGDFNVERSSLRGHDPNINRFCLMPALDAWVELQQAFPDLLPEPQSNAIAAGLRQLVQRQYSDYGSERLPAESENRSAAYPNMDAHYVLIMELAHRLWKQPLYAKQRDVFLGLIEKTVYPGGALAYVDGQNDCCVYHGITVVCLARYAQLSGDARALAILKRTVDYYPHNVEPAGMPEYFTDPSWKHYWTGCDAAGPAIIASLTGDGRNQQAAQTCGAIWRHGRVHADALAADLAADLAGDLARGVAPKPLPDGYVFFDENIQGPRGRFGAWSFAGNGRLYTPGEQGKDTFVGAMLTDAPRRPMPLDAALQLVTAEVRVRRDGSHWKAGRFLSAEERLSTVVGPQFGSLAVRYTVSPPYERRRRDDLLPWRGTQQWYLGRDRLVGLVALEATADQRRAAVHGRIRLGLDRVPESLPDATWRYGKLVVKLHGHNYAAVELRPSETRFDDPPSVRRSTEITLIDRPEAAGAQNADALFTAGTRFWFLVEVVPQPDANRSAEPTGPIQKTGPIQRTGSIQKTGPIQRTGSIQRTGPIQPTGPLQCVQRIEQADVLGFRWRERDREVVLLHNTGQRPATVDRTAMGVAGSGWTVFADHTGRATPLPAVQATLVAPPQRHLVLQRDGPAR